MKDIERGFNERSVGQLRRRHSCVGLIGGVEGVKTFGRVTMRRAREALIVEFVIVVYPWGRLRAWWPGHVKPY